MIEYIKLFWEGAPDGEPAVILYEVDTENEWLVLRSIDIFADGLSLIHIYAKYEYQDEIECFPDVFALIERELRQCKFDSAAMKTVEALDGKI